MRESSYGGGGRDATKKSENVEKGVRGCRYIGPLSVPIGAHL